MRAKLGHPLFHFALIGSLLFALSDIGVRRDSAAKSAQRQPIYISAIRLLRAEADFQERFGRPAAPSEREALLLDLVNEEILYREALRLSLDSNDPRVEDRLVRKMKIVSRNPEASRADLIAEARALNIDRSDLLIRRMLVSQMKQLLRRDPSARVSEEELAHAVSEAESSTSKPAAVTFSQIYLGPVLPAETEWSKLRDQLADPRDSANANEAFARPLPFGGTLWAQTHARLSRQFDAAFSRRVFALEPGSWSAPIRSPYGHHLLFIHTVLDERPVDRALLRQRALRHISDERAQARLSASLGWLRTLYSIEIEETLADPVSDSMSPRSREAGT